MTGNAGAAAASPVQGQINSIAQMEGGAELAGFLGELAGVFGTIMGA